MRSITNGRRTTRRLGPRLPKLSAILLLATIAVLFAGCGAFGGDQNTFAPEGEVANKQYWYFQMALWPAVVVMIGVFAAIVYLLVRYRRRDDNEPLPHQLHGNQRLEVAWTIAPAILLLGLAVPIVIGIVDLGREPSDDALDVNVTGFRYNWTFEYPDYCCDAEGNALSFTGTPREQPPLHIPIDREIGIHLSSPDVIHSFWVPKLAGKLDVMPGRSNRMWLKADDPGTFAGQCAEFCGLNHAFMRFEVVAQSPEDFEAWANEAWDAQQREAEAKVAEDAN